MIKRETNLFIKYNRVSTIQQTGNRFDEDQAHYDITYLDKVSGKIPFNERPEAKKLIKLINEGKVKQVTIEEFSRLGRNTGDVINSLQWLEDREINIVVRNLGLQSRPNGSKNPIWKMISSIMSSLYEMELENIKERTSVGRKVYVQNGGVLGRPIASNENKNEFLAKENSRSIIKELNKGLTVRQVSKITKSSTKTVQKVKNYITD